MSLDPTTSDFDFKNPKDQGEENDPLLESATKELENQLANPTEKMPGNEADEKPDVTLEDLNVIEETFPKKADSSAGDVEKD